MKEKQPAKITLVEIGAKTCGKCETALLADAVFCHRCGLRVDPADEVPFGNSMIVRLHGLYDESRREEFALALIPILANLSRTIDMTDVEHIDIAALASLTLLLEARQAESKPPIEVVGMNDDVHNSLSRADFAKFFNRLP